MNIQFRPHHVSMTVRDMEISTAFYCSIGFQVSHTYTSADGNRRMSHLRSGAFVLELFQFPSRESRASACNRDIHPIGIRHFAIEVSSISEAHKLFSSRGYKCEDVSLGLSGLKYFFVSDPDGIWLEVVEDNRK